MAEYILPAIVRSVERLLSSELPQDEPMAAPGFAFPPLAFCASGFPVSRFKESMLCLKRK